MVLTTPSQEIEAKVIRKNDFGLHVVMDVRSDKQYALMIDKLDDYKWPDFNENCLKEGSHILITVDSDDRVIRARKA